ncbi:MAG: hypothetical protein N4A36_02435 [Candidatus Gracilibacteria bacterium]|nr:hypothetical protein [Candidatus Gracilibacteria bacterium]
MIRTTMGDYFKHIESRYMILGENSNNNDSVVVMSTKKGFKTYG